MALISFSCLVAPDRSSDTAVWDENCEIKHSCLILDLRGEACSLLL